MLDLTAHLDGIYRQGIQQVCEELADATQAS